MFALPTARWGPGIDVLLIHGAAGYKEGWGPLPEALADTGLGVMAVDLPGGALPPGIARPGPASCERHARALVGLLDRIGPVTLVGHSLGAGTALMVARMRPHLVRGIVMLAPVVAPAGLSLAHRPRPAELLAVPVIGPVLARPVLAWARRSAQRRWWSLVGVVGEPERLQPGTPAWDLATDAADRLARLDLGAFVSWTSGALRRGALGVAPWVAAPCLVVAGQRDPLLSAASIGALCERLPMVRSVRMERVGHFPHLEDAATTTALVREHAATVAAIPREGTA